ncbi:hypothetical protein [Pseudomonas fluorescens]|uniref:Uncharacterized protein n=1 Tax=Pseudomonas fluorescens TaxID=294 RepID=A0A5E7CH78_PSEFL|nr:hypothetical protein [Pseudomonas fluorescens]VVO04233.1 hypothetical protein PS691_02871 [Pseudomonas fluorescens]
MLESNKYNTNEDVFPIFEKALPRPSMFLIDSVLTHDPKVVYRSRSGDLEYTYIRYHRKNEWESDIKIFIEGEYWGSLNRKLFDDVPALAAALRKRGLEQVEL